ncbi:TIGR00297 family protein [Candidatus Atelocyanobacterium thalassae]|uniref:TIGR00297 family protein n=1 Tax=Atelocyanobacterium thalassa (isolate ALOHA) TaxID=1453429 RepID=D3ENW9_ATETH|nr:TIGR00297 family protein [Candidatus Atelocyanobacterium thalassa]ADB95169.1 conserved hypothetical protein TIGR00297 [Candidatus Atelocyanobacterium thalassa isolate ALOHA]MCH2543176.1 TIGR00297 family protein [Candidatus Atelocyanobacterium sp. ALOHA_A2.5_9]|tara:strand:- start:73 stop:828 length:756 start_codon:yes stop_codon:yes gene_type:complete
MITSYLDRSWLISIILNSLLLGFAMIIPKKLLTFSGYLHAWLLGVLIWWLLGWQGYILIMSYFIIGSAITYVGISKKEKAGIAEKRSGTRGPENVWGSGLTALFCALGTLFSNPFYTKLFILGYVASISTKLSDTVASELGKVYGKNTFLITTLRPASPGTEGAISLEGTLAGFIASVLIALVGFFINFINLNEVSYCVISAFFATNVESVIGATLQNRVSWMNNDVVNIINTLIGALIAFFLYFLETNLF